MEGEHLPLALGQAPDRVNHGCRLFLAEDGTVHGREELWLIQGVVGRNAFGVRTVCGLGRAQENRVSPREERGLTPERTVRFECTQHRFLHNVLHIGRRPAEDRCGARQGRIGLFGWGLKVFLATAYVVFRLQVFAWLVAFRGRKV